MTDLNTLYAGCSAFYLGWSGADEVDSDVVDLLVDAARSYYSHMEQGNDSYAELALEASSTYVQCDLSGPELEEYVELFENYLGMASEGELEGVA
jgi:hypothetical protein